LAALTALFGWVEQAPSSILYEPVHNLTGPGGIFARLSRVGRSGVLQPEEVLVINVTGIDEPKPFKVLNDTSFLITALHWEIPPTGDPRIAPGTPVLDEPPVPAGWIQPDVAFGDIQPGGNGQAGKSDLFSTILPLGPGPTNSVHFTNGLIPPNTFFTDDKRFLGASIPEHYALVWYSGVPIPEPSSLLLCGIATFGLVGYAWRRQRAA
jgi:hypothetical protein